MDVCLIGFLSFRAYRDGKWGGAFRGLGMSCADVVVVDMLDRFEVPVFGRLASRFVDAE